MIFFLKYKIFNFRENYITTICDEHTDKNFDKFRAYANCVGCQDEIQTSELNISWTQRTIFLEFLYFFTSFQSSKFSRSRRLLPNKKLNLMPASSTGHTTHIIRVIRYVSYHISYITIFEQIGSIVVWLNSRLEQLD